MISNIFSSFAASESGIPMLMLLLKATLILLVALGVTLSMQRASAGARHLVWLVTLATLLLVPALMAWVPIPIRILPATGIVLPTLVSSTAREPKVGSHPIVNTPQTNAAPAEALSAPAKSLENEIASSPVLSGLSIA